jgi:hypothetical protein
MFGASNDSSGGVRGGAIRAVGKVVAPKLTFKAAGREERVDLRADFGPTMDQGPLLSCAACATVALVEYHFKKTNGRLVRGSAMFLYYNARKINGTVDQNVGMLVNHAPAALMAFGLCEENAWPYRVDTFTQEPSAQCYLNATAAEAIQYARLGSTEEIKVSLSQSLPVIFGSDIPRPYYEAAAKTGRMPEYGAIQGGEPVGHGMVVVGYDDKDQSWLIRNSAGPAFGEKGYFRMPYSVFNKHVWTEDVWTIGALEKLEQRTLIDGTVPEAVAEVRLRGAAQMESALKALGKEIRDDLQKRGEDAKLSIRERLQAQERELAARRNRGGGDTGNGGR